MAIQHIVLRASPSQVRAELNDIGLEDDGHIATISRYKLPRQAFNILAVDELDGDYFILLNAKPNDNKLDQQEGDRGILYAFLRNKRGVISIQIAHIAETSNWNPKRALECLGTDGKIPEK